LSKDKTYTFESSLDGTKILSSTTLEDVQSYGDIRSRPQNAIITIPLEPTLPGAIMLNSRIQQDTEWMYTTAPGENIEITHVGIRRGGMVSMNAHATRLALDTPYIALPDEMYDVLVQATKPVPHQHSTGYDDVVDCSRMDIFPDIVLGLEPETDEEEEDDETTRGEIVITPDQYVLETEEGKCILLSKRAYRQGREEVVLGWAAVRGRSVVLDWVNERTGFDL
jgi:hypothetical protein